jgi:serine protease Do
MKIEVSTCDEEGVGSGFLLSPRLVATVEHVVEGAQSIKLRRSGNVVAAGTVIGSDVVRDVALLRTDRPIVGHMFKLVSRPPRLGESVIAIGFPLGLPLSVSRGLISGSDRVIEIGGIQRRKLIQTDAATNFGNSGGPLIVTSTGDVLGLVDIGTTEANGLAFAVSAQVAGPLFDAWKVAPQPVAVSGCGSSPTETQVAAPPLRLPRCHQPSRQVR